MKTRYLILSLAAALLCSACAKDDASDAYGGYKDPFDGVRDYLTGIADELITQNLQELETALVSSSEEISRYFYEKNGKELTEDGAVWTVTRDGVLKGLVISKVNGQNSWKLDFDGDFSLNSHNYRTSYTMTATAADASISPHRSWNVTIDGQRHEKEDFWCEFHNDGGALEYKSLSENKYWNAYGFLLMTVYDGKKQIDKVVMQLKGGKSDSVIAHIE